MKLCTDVQNNMLNIFRGGAISKCKHLSNGARQLLLPSNQLQRRMIVIVIAVTKPMLLDGMKCILISATLLSRRSGQRERLNKMHRGCPSVRLSVYVCR